MDIVLGGLTLDGRLASVRETYEEVGGRDARQIEINGLIVGNHSVIGIEARLDAVMGAASEAGYATALIVRPGRRALVRRVKFTREIARDSMVGRYSLTLEARDPFDEATEVTQTAWNIEASGTEQALSNLGNLAAPLTVMLTAAGTLINPRISDGVNSLSYSGTVNAGETLTLDGQARKALLAATDVTAYTNGQWPRVRANGSSIVFTDDAQSSHQAHAVISYRERWW